MTASLTCRIVALALVLALAPALPALAQYFPELPETPTEPVSPEDSLLVEWKAETSAIILEALGVTKLHVFRADPARPRVFSPERGDASGGTEDSATAPATTSEMAFGSVIQKNMPASYLINGSPVLIGFGEYYRISTDGVGSGYGVVVSFVVDSGGNAILIDKRHLLSLTLTLTTVQLFALDLNANGLLDLVIQNFPDISGGGGVIELLSVGPDGKFRDFTGGPYGQPTRIRGEDVPPVQCRINSAYSACSMNDFDSDGIWEIVTAQYIDYWSAVGSYTYLSIFAWDADTNGFQPCTSRFPEVIAPQQQFYEALINAIWTRPPGEDRDYTGLLKEPYVWDYDGQRYSIDFFPSASAEELEVLVSNWDAYPQGIMGLDLVEPDEE